MSDSSAELFNLELQIGNCREELQSYGLLRLVGNDLPGAAPIGSIGGPDRWNLKGVHDAVRIANDTSYGLYAT